MLLALLPIAAAEEASTAPSDVAQILFLTDAVYAPTNDTGVATSMYTLENHVYWQQDSRHIIVMDVHGNRLFNEMFYSAIELPNGLRALAKDQNYALYRGSTRLTGYDYYTVTVECAYMSYTYSSYKRIRILLRRTAYRIRNHPSCRLSL